VFAPLDAWFHEHLYAVAFLGALVDATGVPFPGRIMLITVGSLSGPAEGAGASAGLLIALATLGTVTWRPHLVSPGPAEGTAHV